MAVPKKRTSKSKKNSRRYNWKKKASMKAIKVLAQGKLIFKTIFNNLEETKKTDPSE